MDAYHQEVILCQLVQTNYRFIINEKATKRTCDEEGSVLE